MKGYGQKKAAMLLFVQVSPPSLLWIRQNNRSQEYLSENILLQLRENTFSFTKIIIIFGSMISHMKSIL